MNTSPSDCAPPRTPRARATARCAILLALGALFAGAPCGTAQGPVLGPAPTDLLGIERLVAADAARHLESPLPACRGEAALIVATTGDPALEARLLTLADDRDPVTADRAAIALGLLATPGAVHALEQRIAAEDRGARAVAPAFALGLVPPDRAGSAIGRVLPTFARGSWKRQRDALLALLIGMGRHADRDERVALRRLFDDDSNRDAEVRAALLQLLLPVDTSFDDKSLKRLCDRGSDAERLVLLRWLAGRTPVDNGPWLDTLVQIAQHDRQPAHRAAALAALTRSRHLPALELAARALRSDDADECGAGLRAMLAIGGARTRGALEQHLIDEHDAGRKAALLASYAAPPSQRLALHAAALAHDETQPEAVRVAAAEVLSKSQPERAAPLLRDLFRDTRDGTFAAALARALVRGGDDPPTLDRLLAAPTALELHPLQWQALLHGGHAAAQRHVLAVLQAAGADPETVATALRCWRAAMVLAVPALPGIATPTALQRALAG